MGNKTTLKYVPPWSIVRLSDGRLGVTPNKPTAKGYCVSLDGNNQLGTILKGTTEVEVVKYPAQIAMEALEVLINEEECKQIIEDKKHRDSVFFRWEAAGRKCTCGNPIEFEDAYQHGECIECLHKAMVEDCIV